MRRVRWLPGGRGFSKNAPESMAFEISSGNWGAMTRLPICWCPVSELPCTCGSNGSNPAHSPAALVGTVTLAFLSRSERGASAAHGTYRISRATCRSV